jgi:hypothetical protein
MSRRVIRMARRRTAWEGASVDDAIDVEFRDRSGAIDLRPSVYVFDAEEPAVHPVVVRLRAEHSFSLLQSPNAAGTQINLEGASPCPLTQSPGTTRFEFANASHHELVLAGEPDLRQLVQAAQGTFQQREHPVSRDEAISYATTREDAGDPEWIAVLADPAKKEWRKLVARHRLAKERSS